MPDRSGDIDKGRAGLKHFTSGSHVKRANTPGEVHVGSEDQLLMLVVSLQLAGLEEPGEEGKRKNRVTLAR